MAEMKLELDAALAKHTEEFTDVIAELKQSMQGRPDEAKEEQSPKQAAAGDAPQAGLSELREEIGRIAAETDKLKGEMAETIDKFREEMTAAQAGADRKADNQLSNLHKALQRLQKQVLSASGGSHKGSALAGADLLQSPEESSQGQAAGVADLAVLKE